jgi:hypothetical protein
VAVDSTLVEKYRWRRAPRPHKKAQGRSATDR